MKLFRSFFYFTRIFWVISRLFLAVVFGYCTFFLLEGAEADDYISAAFFALVAVGFLWNFFAGLFREHLTKVTGIFLGSFLILAGLAGFYATVNIFGFAESAGFFVATLYLVLAGCFELFGWRFKRRRRGENLQSSELPLNS